MRQGKLKRITLEASLKPFRKTSLESIHEVCHGIFRQWRPLLKNAEEISILLWTSDGSEILEYDGNLDSEFEWCRYIGSGVLEFLKPEDREDISLHVRKRSYTDDPPVMTYRILKQIVEAFRVQGQAMFPNAEIRIGDTFDIGPEFADSDFKYRRHREICPFTWNEAGDCVEGRFIDATARLHGDTRMYAAFPNGIPDQTPFGRFLGCQTKRLFEDVGFDYLWLSNGLGFSSEPWSLLGKIYDGQRFYPERLKRIRSDVFEFWNCFREVCPDIPLECRGTNNSAGIDYATDGVPLYELYHSGLNITPPPNSPWAALNGDYGLELMGHMSRICDLPCDDFMFRYYIHDPWWANSPWYDRYEGEPHDIYLPMSVARLTSEGCVQSAQLLNLLTVDNSYGEMPDSCANEPIPHLLKAIKDAPDAVSPFVWVYPVREYTTATCADELSEMYFDDCWIRDEINKGFPLNCVVSTDAFAQHETALYRDSILILSVTAAESLGDRLMRMTEAGIPVIVYGSRKRLEPFRTAGMLPVDVETGSLSAAIRTFGYDFEWARSPYPSERGGLERAMTVSRSDNAFFVSVCNQNTTLDCAMRFPMGAPILLGGEAELRDGKAIYRFPRSAHRECRILIDQKQNGVVSAREMPVVNTAFRRAIEISGLQDATVYFFPETYCMHTARVGTRISDGTPEYFDDVEVGETYLKCEHKSGRVMLFFPREGKHEC